MSRKLDRDRYYAMVYGDETENPKRPRKFFQDGIYFDGAGVAIEGSAPPKHTPAPSATPVEAVETDSPNVETLKELNGLHISKLKKLAVAVNEATGAELPEMSGTGLKARLVRYITDNSE
jgi:hypothetical protein